MNLERHCHRPAPVPAAVPEQQRFGGKKRMADLPLEDYKRLVEKFTRLAADDFRQSAATEQEQRAALCRYFRRGADADLSHPELIDFLGVSTPSVLDMAGYSHAAADRVMLMLRDMKDDELYGASV